MTTIHAYRSQATLRVSELDCYLASTSYDPKTASRARLIGIDNRASCTDFVFRLPSSVPPASLPVQGGVGAVFAPRSQTLKRRTGTAYPHSLFAGSIAELALDHPVDRGSLGVLTLALIFGIHIAHNCSSPPSESSLGSLQIDSCWTDHQTPR